MLNNTLKYLTMVSLFMLQSSYISYCKAQHPFDSLRVKQHVEQRIHHARVLVDSILDYRDANTHSSVDTLFLEKSPEKLRIKLVNSISGSEMIAEGNYSEGSFKSLLDAQRKYTLSVAAAYRGLSVSLSFNPAKLSGRKQDYELNMNVYGNRFGADLIYHAASNFKGSIETNRGKLEMPTDLIHTKIGYLTAYYVFNARKFSYPAAFTLSWLQRRSSGSFILGASATGGEVKVTANDDIGNGDYTQRFIDCAVGGGYAYNFVFPHRWLLHLSALPQLVIYNHSKAHLDDQSTKMPYRFPNFITSERVAIIKHYDKYFAGITTVLNTSTVGDRDQLHLNSFKWRTRLIFGFKI